MNPTRNWWLQRMEYTRTDELVPGATAKLYYYRAEARTFRFFCGTRDEALAEAKRLHPIGSFICPAPETH